MKSSRSVVRLPGPVRGVAVARAESRDVSSYSFSEESALACAARDAVTAATDAEARVATASAEAHRRGLVEGLARGREQGEAESREAARLLAAITVRLSAERAAVLAGAESDLLSLAIAVASRIVRREVSIDREIVVRVLEDALRRVSPLEEVVVRVHPSDYLALREAPGVLSALAEARQFELAEDRRVGQGGCLIETGSGAIDARLESALDEIGRALARAADEERGDADRS